MMTAFLVAGVVAVGSSVMVVTRRQPMHALLYLVVSLLSVAVLFALLGAPFAAALEIILYAGAIMVLFLFVVMLLNLGGEAAERERRWLRPRVWLLPGALGLVMAGELLWLLLANPVEGGAHQVAPQEVGRVLFSRYLLGVEIASFLLLAGLIGAFHLGRRGRR
jgi:NADH-quinone oxidoreductase subunit J